MNARSSLHSARREHSRGLCAGLVSLVLLMSAIPMAGAQAFSESGLEAFLSFDEGNGTSSADLTGNGHTGTLTGASWGSGYVQCTGEGQVVHVISGAALQSDSFTYDFWFEASGSTGAYGRLVAQADHSGGDGPDVLENYGKVAIRITSGSDAVFNAPTVGSLSTPAPPNHFGNCDDNFHREDGPEHVVVTHDEPEKRVRIFIGLEGDPLRLCFEATYTGSYSTDTGPLGICNHPSPDHVFRAKYYQLAYYSRTLTYQVDGNRNVISGELFDNHQAGSAATLSSPPEPDAGVEDAEVQPGADAGPVVAPDAAPTPDAAFPGTDADSGETPNQGVSSGCGCASGLGGQGSALSLGLLLLGLWLVRRRPGTPRTGNVIFALALACALVLALALVQTACGPG